MPVGAAAVARGAGLRTLFLVLALALSLGSVLGPWSPVPLEDFHQNLIKWSVMAEIWLRHGWFQWFPSFAGGSPTMAGPLPPWSLNVLLSTVLPPWLLYMALRAVLLFAAGFGSFLLLHRFLEVPRARALLLGGLYCLTVINQPVIDVFTFFFPLFAAWGLEALTPGMSRFARLLRGMGMLLVAGLSLPGLTVPYFPVLHVALVLFLLPAHLRTRPVLPGTLLLWTAYGLLFAPHFLGVLEYTPFMQGPGPRPLLADNATAFALAAGSALLTPLTALFLFVLPTARRNPKVLLGALFAVVPAVLAGICGMGPGFLYIGSFLVDMEPTRAVVLVQLGQLLTIGLGLPAMVRHSALTRFWGLICLCLPFALGNMPLAALSALVGLAGMSGEIFLDLRGRGYATTRRADWAWIIFITALSAACLLSVQRGLLAEDSGFYARGYMDHPALSELADQMTGKAERVAGADMHPSVPQLYGLETVGSEEPPNRRWAELLLAAQAPLLERTPGARREDTLFSVTRTLNKPTALDHSRQQPLFVDDWNWGLVRLMNVSRIVSSKPIDGIEGEARLTAFDRGGAMLPDSLSDTLAAKAYTMALWIYEVRDPLPRAFCARQVVLLPQEEILSGMMEETGEGFRERVYIATEDVGDAAWPEDRARPASDCSAQLDSYLPSHMEITATADGPCFLVVSANWNPWWEATVNGRAVPVLRANHALMAIRVDGVGPFNITLRYDNRFLQLIHLASVAGILLSFAAFLLPGGGQPPVPTPLPTEAMAGHSLTRAARRVSVKMLLLLLAGWVAGYLYLTPLSGQPQDAWLSYYALGAAGLATVAVWFWAHLLNRRW